MAEIITLIPAQLEETNSSQTIGSTIALTIAATGLIALSAHVAVPLFFTPVPITLQTLAVLFLGLVLGPRWAFATLCLYLAEGAAGLPVFNPHGPGGILQILGPTGGYLLSYPFAAAAAGLLSQVLNRVLDKKAGSLATGARFTAALISAFLPTVLILAAGAAWLAIETHQPAHAVFAEAVVPFLIGDLAKVFLAASAATGIRRIQAKMNPS